MRRAAVNYTPPSRPYLSDPSVPWLKRKFWGVIFAVVDLLRRPAYAVPLLLNVTGSVWFFLLIGKAGMFLAFWNKSINDLWPKLMVLKN